jgi:hypothetical protein
MQTPSEQGFTEQVTSQGGLRILLKCDECGHEMWRTYTRRTFYKDRIGIRWKMAAHIDNAHGGRGRVQTIKRLAEIRQAAQQGKDTRNE